jgi:hypothetical protein
LAIQVNNNISLFGKRILSISLEMDRSRLVVLSRAKLSFFNFLDNFAPCKTTNRLLSISL